MLRVTRTDKLKSEEVYSDSEKCHKYMEKHRYEKMKHTVRHTVYKVTEAKVEEIIIRELEADYS